MTFQAKEFGLLAALVILMMAYLVTLMDTTPCQSSSDPIGCLITLAGAGK